MESTARKVKGAILSFIGLALSLEGVFCFSFFALTKFDSFFWAYLSVSGYFLLEASGRAYGLYFTWRHKNDGERGDEAKGFLAFFLGVAETFYPLLWLLATALFSSAMSEHVTPFALYFLLSKSASEIFLSISRLLPYRKKRISLASESLCSFCVSLSLLLSYGALFLIKENALPSNFPFVYWNWIIFVALFIVQNVFFSILLLQGEMPKRIRNAVTKGVRQGVGNYILVSSSLQTALISTIIALQQQNIAFGAVGWAFLTLGLIRLTSLLWKNALQRNIHNQELAISREAKICVYVGTLLIALAFPFSLGTLSISQANGRNGGDIALYFQISHGLLRLILCIRNAITYRRKKQPFSFAMTALDLITCFYTVNSVFFLLDYYFHFAWFPYFIWAMGVISFILVALLGTGVLIFGINGWVESNRKETKMKTAWEELKKQLQSQRKTQQLLQILGYDLQTTCPEKALASQGELMGVYESQLAASYQSEEFISAVEKAKQEGPLSLQQERVVDELNKEVEFMKKVDLATYQKWQDAYRESNRAWRKAKEENDFKSYLPFWEKCIQSKIEEAELRRKDEKTLYDVCLGMYEPDLTADKLDAIFASLKEFLIPKIKEVVGKQKEWKTFEIKPYSEEKQRKLAVDLLDLIQYDFKRGAFRESPHPFSDCIGENDIRLTCHYDSDFRSNLFTILHEGGHCLQFQGWGKDRFENGSEGLTSAAICETHSRFYENIIGRAKEFTPVLKKLVVKDLDDSFAAMDEESFYRLMNVVSPSAIRCDADELTYVLHIIIRYEIEKDLINGEIKCKDVPSIWNKKYKDYLGYSVKSNAEGCLQDVHWSDGEIGYFPSYALGNIYGAQILHAMKKDIDFSSCLRNGDLTLIRSWFTKVDWPEDWRKPSEWLKKVTGEDMNPSYYIDYLNQKY